MHEASTRSGCPAPHRQGLGLRARARPPARPPKPPETLRQATPAPPRHAEPPANCPTRSCTTARRHARGPRFEHLPPAPPVWGTPHRHRPTGRDSTGARLRDRYPPHQSTGHPDCRRDCCSCPALGPSLPAANTTAMPALLAARDVTAELQIAGTCRPARQRPRRIDDIGRIERRRIAVGIHQPLKGEVNVAHARAPGTVEHPHRDPARVGRHAQRRAAQDHTHRLRAVAERIVGRGFLAMRIEPAVRAAAPLALQVRMREDRRRCPWSRPPRPCRSDPAPTTPAPERRRCSSPESRAWSERAGSSAGGAAAAGAGSRSRWGGVRGAGVRCERPCCTNESSSMRSMPGCLASSLTATAGTVAASPLMIHRSLIRCAPCAISSGSTAARLRAARALSASSSRLSRSRRSFTANG